MSQPGIDRQRLLEVDWLADVEWHATIGSTNDRARVLAADPAARLPLLVVADNQTAGRGRGANRWWTGRGGLAMSLLVGAEQLDLHRRHAPLAGLAAAVAVVEAASRRLPGRAVGLHWPNDVYVGDRKLAGVLVELPRPDRWVIGIGVNVNNTLAEAPPELASTATTLRDLTGQVHDRTQVALEVLSHLWTALAAIPASPEGIAQRANSLCLQRGRALWVEQGGRVVYGQCVGIDRHGALVLQTELGRQRILSGTVRR